jgi:hypothetical protein
MPYLIMMSVIMMSAGPSDGRVNQCLPVNPLQNVAHEVANVGHEDEEKGYPDESVDDAEHLTLVRLRNDVTVTSRKCCKKLQS